MVPSLKISPHERLNTRNCAAGYSIIELLVVVGILFVITSFAVIGIRGTIPKMRVNAALNQVVSQMRIAREQAISLRRDVQVQFIGNNQIQLTRLNPPSAGGGTVVLSTVTLEGRARFLLFSGVPDTPDALGNSAAISFGGTPTMLFMSDGTFVDTNGVPLNGTIFLGMQGDSTTARAVTILGPTGRVRGYKWTGNSWAE